ncbi:MAG: DUF5615 family PIN-like protein [Candidatus Aenigmatarchaeota archaeon]
MTWVHYGSFSETYAPTVVLDQNISGKRFAQNLYECGIRVERPKYRSQIPDNEILARARMLNAMVVTMDKDFDNDDYSLVVPPGIRLKKDGKPIIDAVRFVFRKIDELPPYPNGHHLKPDERMHKIEMYHDRLLMLRKKFSYE